MWFDAQSGFSAGSVIAGVVIGVAFGVSGALANFFLRKRKFKGFVLTYFVVMFILGAISLCAGVAALVMRQQHNVWYPLVFTGIILLVTMRLGYKNVRKFYARKQ